jgi:hypothetical protein
MVRGMVAHELILDPETPGLVHTTVACEALVGLTDLLDTGRDCPQSLLDTAARHGLVIPTWAGRGLTPCVCCTLVAAPVWAIAA